jgi:CPA2 family monovalent cation:H+ antiporter-2
LQRLGIPFVIIEADQNRLESLQKQKLPAIYGDGASAEVLHAAHIEHARMVLIAVGSAVDVESIARQARTVSPAVHIVARAAVINQVEVLHALGIHEVVQPEFEAGLEMMRQTLLHFGIASTTIEQMSDEVRDAAYLPIRTATERVEG